MLKEAERQLPPGRPPHLRVVEEFAETSYRPHQIGRRVLGRSLAGPQQHPLEFFADVLDLLPVGGLLVLLDPRPLPRSPPYLHVPGRSASPRTTA